MLERMSLIENILLKDPDFAGKKKDAVKGPEGAKAGTIVEAESKITFSTNVLLLNEDGSYCATVTMSDLLRRAIGVYGVNDPDTPRAKALTALSPFACREPEDKMASDTTCVLLSDLEKYIASPTVPMQEPWKLSRIIVDAGRASGFTSFDYGTELAAFASMTVAVLSLAKDALMKEPLYHQIESPVYVFGDIHGNFVDLQYFLSGLLTFDDIMMKYSGHSLLFLGDYVDRGSCSLECILYLLVLKLINPKKVYLLRGNHESPEVNGDVECYSYSSFKYQCIERFGRDKGMEIWTKCNDVFAYLPLCASIDSKIFCVHGGLPQYNGGDDRRLDILKDPNFPRFAQVQCDASDNRELRLMVNDLLWSDPATRGSKLNEHGFGPNPRGPDIRSFGTKAVDEFCQHFGFQFIFRAHQEKADGLRLSDNARVVTIFSTSDYAGHQNGAGCIYVNKKKIRLVIKKPKLAQKPSATPQVAQPRPPTSPTAKKAPSSPGKPASPTMMPFFR
jgi:protein phosphatase